MNKPELGATIAAVYDKNYDGDTIDFSFAQKFKIRVTDEVGIFDTPELGFRARHNAENWLGLKVKSKVEELLSTASNIHINIPAGKQGILGDSFAVGTRVAGIVWFEHNGFWDELSSLLKKLEFTKGDSDILDMVERAYKSQNCKVYDSIEELESMSANFNHPIKNEYSYLNRLAFDEGYVLEYLEEKYDIKAKKARLLVGFNKEVFLGLL